MGDENVLVSFRGEDQLTSVLRGLETSFASLTKSIQTLESNVTKSFNNQSKEVSNSNKAIQSELKKTEGSFLSLKNIINTALGVSLSGILAGAVNGIRNFAGEALNMTAKLESVRIGFDVLTGSADLARSTLKDLSDYAKSTPFELPQLQQTALRLKGVGFETKDLLSVIDVLGNISAGVGTEKLPLLVLALSQVKNAGKLTGNELRQFTENNVPLVDLLAKSLGKTTAEITQMTTEGKIGFNDVYKVLDQLTSKGGKYFDLMNAQSKSFSGVMSNIKDQIGVLSRTFMGITEEGDIIAGGFFDKIKNSAEGLMIMLNNLGYLLNGQLNFEQFLQFSGVSEQVISAIQMVGGAFQWLGEHIIHNLSDPLNQGLILGIGIGSMIFDFLIPAVTGLATTIGTNLGRALTFIMSPTGLVIAGVALLYTAWQTNFLGIQETTQSVLQWVGGKFGEFGQFMLTNLDGITNGIFEFVNGGIGGLNTLIKYLSETFAPMFGDITGFVGFVMKGMIEIAGSVIGDMVTIFGNLGKFIIPLVVPVLKQLVVTFGQIFKSVVGIITGATKFIGGIFSGDWRKMVEGLIDMLAGFAGGVASIWDGINSLISKAIAGILDMILEVTKNDFIAKGLELVGLSGAVDSIKNLSNDLKKTQTGLQDTVKDLAKNAKSFLGIDPNASEKQNEGVSNIADGIIDGITKSIDNLSENFQKADFKAIGDQIRNGYKSTGVGIDKMAQDAKAMLYNLAKNPPQIALLGEQQKGAIKSLIQALGQGAMGFGSSLSQVQTGKLTMPDFGALFSGLSGQAKAYTPAGEQDINAKVLAGRKSTLEDYLKQATGNAGGSGSKSGKSPAEVEIENQKKVLQLQEKQLQLTKQNLQAQQDTSERQLKTQGDTIRNELDSFNLTKKKAEYVSAEATNLQSQVDSLQQRVILEDNILPKEELARLQNELEDARFKLGQSKLLDSKQTDSLNQELVNQELALKQKLEAKQSELNQLKSQQSSQIDQLEAKARELNNKQLELDIRQFGSDISGQTGDKNLTINGVNINNTSDLDQFSQLLKNALA